MYRSTRCRGTRDQIANIRWIIGKARELWKNIYFCFTDYEREWKGWLIFLGSKIISDGACSHEIIRCLLLGRKPMTKLDSILKSRDITLLSKVHIVKAMVFPIVMYGGESWTIRKAEHWRIDAFKLWCWRSLLRVPQTARWSNLSILKEINPEYSFIGRIDGEAETPILWPPDVNS